MFQENLPVPYSRVKQSNEGGNDRLPQNVGNYKSALHNIPEESQLLCGRSLKSRRMRGESLHYQVEMLHVARRKLKWFITEDDDNDQPLNLFRSSVPYTRQLPPTKKGHSFQT
jgi:hypothetical protein